MSFDKWIYPCNQLPSQAIEHSRPPEKFGKNSSAFGCGALLQISCLKVYESPLHGVRGPSMASEQNFWISPFCWWHAFWAGESLLAFFVWIFLCSFVCLFVLMSLFPFLMDLGSIFYGLAPLWVSLTKKVIQRLWRVRHEKRFSVASEVYLTAIWPQTSLRIYVVFVYINAFFSSKNWVRCSKSLGYCQ